MILHLFELYPIRYHFFENIAYILEKGQYLFRNFLKKLKSNMSRGRAYLITGYNSQFAIP